MGLGNVGLASYVRDPGYHTKHHKTKQANETTIKKKKGRGKQTL
jgi:hypothetical protein